MEFLIPIVLIVAFWFLLIRPQQKRQQALRQLQSSLGPGDEVMLTSGIYATVVEVTDDHIVVSVADGVNLKVVRAAIGQVLPKPEPEDETGTEPQTPAEPEES